MSEGSCRIAWQWNRCRIRRRATAGLTGLKFWRIEGRYRYAAVGLTTHWPKPPGSTCDTARSLHDQLTTLIHLKTKNRVRATSLTQRTSATANIPVSSSELLHIGADFIDKCASRPASTLMHTDQRHLWIDLLKMLETSVAIAVWTGDENRPSIDSKKGIEKLMRASILVTINAVLASLLDPIRQ